MGEVGYGTFPTPISPDLCGARKPTIGLSARIPLDLLPWSPFSGGFSVPRQDMTLDQLTA